jgi:selenocysteine lyase/cysteine desulfurase
MEQAIDANTRLVSIALVSNVNGFVADIASLSDLAHARGAYLYADIMQAAGAVPIDVRASGIDMAACSTFKWLMGVKGFGYVYVRADLQGTVVAPTQHAGGVSFNYEPWIDDPDATRPAVDFRPTEGPGRYEVSYPSYEGAVCAQQSLQYIERLGVDNIRAHARKLTDRLHDELPRLGYDSITPRDNDSPILSFVSPDPDQTVSRCQEAGVHVAMRFGNKLRLAPSVYNNHEDVDQLLSALT